MKTGRLNVNAWLVALGVTLVCAVVAGLGAASFATGSGASSEIATGLYPGSAAPAASPESRQGPTRMWPASTPSSEPSASPTPTPAPATATFTPSPVVLGAAATPAPETPARRRACPPYPILLDPAPGLDVATQGAIEKWDAYLGCPVFEIAPGGLRIQYEPGWPGDCLDPDIAACTTNGIFLSPVEPLYDPQSVITHELGHVLNFEHGEGPAVMDPAQWSGPGTVWCDLDRRCGP